MGSVCFGGPVEVSTFTDHVATGERLAAVVFRRAKANEAKTTKTWLPLGILRFAFMVLKFRLTRKRMMRTLREEHERNRLPPEYSDGVGRGADRIMYSSSRRRLRIGGDEYSLPEAHQALVVLVDDDDKTVVQRIIDAPTASRPRLDQKMEKEARIKLMIASNQRVNAVWNEALSRDPVIAEFLKS